MSENPRPNKHLTAKQWDAYEEQRRKADRLCLIADAFLRRIEAASKDVGVTLFQQGRDELQGALDDYEHAREEADTQDIQGPKAK